MATIGSSSSDPRTGTTGSQGGAEATGKEEHLSDRVRQKGSELRQRAEDTAEGMRERARSAVDHQKDATVGRIEGVAHALRSVSDDLRDRGQPMVAEYSRHLAEGLESMAQSLSRRNVDDLVGGIEDFARQRPVAFIGGAMVAGFALARFMKSSSARRSRPGGAEYGHSRGAEYGRSGGSEYGERSGATGGPSGAASWPGGAPSASPASPASGAGGYGSPTEGGI